MILFYNSYGKIYTSDILSLSSIISLIFLCLLIFVPLFMAYSTEDFWQRVKICQEQPYVQLKKKYFISTLEKNQDNRHLSKFHTSSELLNSKIDSVSSDDDERFLITGFSISILNIDENGDSFNDKIQIKMSFMTENLLNIKMMFFFDYYLLKKSRFYTESMMYLDIDANNANSIILNGELKLKQKSPIAQISIPKILKDKYLFGVDRESPYDMLALYNKYSNRNVTTKFEGDLFLSPKLNNDNNKVEIILNVYIPKIQDVLYYASFGETIKEAWIQYIYIFIPIYFLVHFILGFIIRNRVFPCSVQSDIEGDDQDIY